MTKETLQKDLEKALDKMHILYTRLRTPGYGRRGIRYPGDYVVWFPNRTFLIECKQTKKLPFAPSHIRQMPFMEQWAENEVCPSAFYGVLTSTEDGYCIFSHIRAVRSKEAHKGLTKDRATYFAENLQDLIMEICNE